jgi:isochorismate synthase
LKETTNTTLTDTLCHLFHPTSAVGGMPLEEAMQFIHQTESYKRSLYAGYLGPQNLKNDGECNFYVNIRCLRWHQTYIELFAGAGITASSYPEKEFQETENKMATLFDVLREG